MDRWLGSAAFLGLFTAACGSTVRNFGTGGDGTGGAGTTSSTQTGGAATGGTGTTGGAGGTGTVYTGPKLVKSIPADGDGQAGLDSYFLLYFDRPMSYSGATGKIQLTSDQVPAPVFAQVSPCPDADATCVAGVFPKAFADASNPNGNKLPGGVKHTITVDKSYADPNGNTFDADVAVSFTTFQYTSNIFDDSGAISDEAGGLDYDPSTQALFACGDSPSNTLAIRRIPLVAGQPGSATMYNEVDTSGTGGTHCYGLDIYEKKLYVSHTYGARVLTYQNLTLPSSPNGPTTIVGPATQLAAPDDKLNNVHSVAAFAGGTRLLLASGYYYVTPEFTGVLSFQGGAWSVFAPAKNVFDQSEGFTVAGDLAGGHLYVMAKDKILKLRASDALIENQHTVPNGAPYDPQLRVDSAGRLYVGGGNGITVYDTAGSTGFSVVASRPGLDAGRFALVENGNDVVIYFMRFRDKGILGRTVIKY